MTSILPSIRLWAIGSRMPKASIQMTNQILNFIQILF